MTASEVERALRGEAKSQILPEFARDKWNLNIAGLKVQADEDVLNMGAHFLFDNSEKLCGYDGTGSNRPSPHANRHPFRLF